jgi:hypothetical protein
MSLRSPQSIIEYIKVCLDHVCTFAKPLGLYGSINIENYNRRLITHDINRNFIMPVFQYRLHRFNVSVIDFINVIYEHQICGCYIPRVRYGISQSVLSHVYSSSKTSSLYRHTNKKGFMCRRPAIAYSG